MTPPLFVGVTTPPCVDVTDAHAGKNSTMVMKLSTVVKVSEEVGRYYYG